MCLVSIFFIDTFFLVRAGSSLYFLLTKIIRAKLFKSLMEYAYSIFNYSVFIKDQNKKKLKPPTCQKEKRKKDIVLKL